MLPLRLLPPDSDFAPKLQSQTLRAPEAGLSRTPLKPPCHCAAPRLPRPEDAALRSSLLQQDLSKGHFLPRTLLPSPTLPRAQLQKQLLLPPYPLGRRGPRAHTSRPRCSQGPHAAAARPPPPSAACPQHSQTRGRLQPDRTQHPDTSSFTRGFPRTGASIQGGLISRTPK